MKKSLNRLNFFLRFILKNIISSPIKSILMLIGFLGVFVSLILAFSMRDFFTSYYYGKLEETYEDYDLIMSISPLGQTRFFSVSSLNSDESIHDAIDKKAMFFEFDVLLQKNEDVKTYVHVKASNLEMLKNINDYVSYPSELLDDEMIITESLALSMDIKMNDQVYIDISGEQKTFVVVDIVEDDMLFSGEQIFIDKTEGLPFFLSALSPSLESLNPALLTNIYNRVYLDIKDSYDIDEVSLLIQSKEPYRLLTFELTIDDEAIHQFIQRNITAFFMIISISLFAIIFVLKTTLEVYFHEKKQLYATIHILGGKKRFSVAIVTIEMLIFFILSFLIAVFLSQQIIYIGLNYLTSHLYYQIQQIHIIYAASLALILLGAVVYFYFKKFYQTSEIRSLNHLDLDNDVSISVKIGTLILLIGIYLVLSFTNIRPLFKGYQVIFILVVIIYLLIYAIDLIFYGLKKYWYQNHQEQTTYYHIKAMLTKRTFKQYLHLVLIAFLTILLLVFANTYMLDRKDAYQETYQIDLMVINITKNYDDKYIDIKAVDEVKDISKAGLFQQVKTMNENQSIRELISMDPTDISTYFKTNIESEALSALNRVTKLYIVLPDRYMFLYDYKIGDTIDIYVDGKYKEQTFEIAGFFEKQLGDIAFTNMHHVYEADDIFNIFLVNAKEDKVLLKDHLLDQYHQDLIQVIDVDEKLAPLIFEMIQVTNYITFILAIIILCFVVALMNHSVLLYHDMKEVYARMIILGLNHQQMRRLLMKLFVYIFISLAIISMIGYSLISLEMADLAIIFGEYEPIRFSIKPLWLGGLIIAITFSLTQWFYILKIKDIDPTKVLKLNQL